MNQQQFDQAERSHEAAWLAREEDGDDDLVRERAAELLAEGEQDEDAYYDWLDSQREAA